jgi:copper(I)-binding protein
MSFKYPGVSCPAIFLLALAGVAHAAPDVAIRDIWIRAMPPVSTMTAAYFTLINEGDKPVTLIGAQSPVAGDAGLHRSMHHDGMEKMELVKQLVVMPQQRLTFSPGGLHVMLNHVKKMPSLGEKVPFCLLFVKGKVCRLFPVLMSEPGNVDTHVHVHVHAHEDP